MKKLDNTNFDGMIECENQCGSPVWAFSKSIWVFETNRLELRVVCGGCRHVQSKQYSEDLINGNIEPPIADYWGNWIYPDDVGYEEAIHYSKHEKLISIKGLPRKDIIRLPARIYS